MKITETIEKRLIEEICKIRNEHKEMSLFQIQDCLMVFCEIYYPNLTIHQFSSICNKLIWERADILLF